MDLTRTQITEGVLAEYDGFAALVEGLTPEQWTTATRCAKWEVRDIAGHVAGTAMDVVSGAIATRRPGGPVPDELRESGPAEIAGRLRDAAKGMGEFLAALDDDAWAGPSGVAELTLGEGVRLLWYDTYVHADDIRAAIGRPSERGPGVTASLSYLEERLRADGFGPARVALDGHPEFAFGTGGPRVQGDPLRFVLAATGRVDPAELGLDETVNIYR